MAITIENAVRKKLVRPGDYIDYQPIIRPESLVLTRDKTGYGEDQTFGEAEKLHWTLEEFEGRLIVVSDEPTSTKIGLGGEVREQGEKLWPQSLNEFCAYHYTDPLMAGEVVAMTKDMFKAIPARRDLCRERYWLGSPYDYTNSGYACFGMCSVRRGRVKRLELFCSYEIGDTYSRGVRPTSFLKYNILLEENFESTGDGSRDNPWKPLRNSGNATLSGKPIYFSPKISEVKEFFINDGIIPSEKIIDERSMELLKKIEKSPKHAK